jgi:hypothetical protein
VTCLVGAVKDLGQASQDSHSGSSMTLASWWVATAAALVLVNDQAYRELLDGALVVVLSPLSLSQDSIHFRL